MLFFFPLFPFSGNFGLDLSLHSAEFGVCSGGVVVCFCVSKSIQGEKPKQCNCAGVLEEHSDEMFPSKICKREVGRAQQTGGIWLRRLPVID